MSWETCLLDSDYEICDEYPYDIRRKSNKRIISEWTHYKGYIECKMNSIKYKKHRIVAYQWVPNPNPEEYDQVDHIDRNPANNHINNLRWVSNKINQYNVKSKGKDLFEYYDEIPVEDKDEIIEVDHYGDHEFEYLYYADNNFYHFNGIQYRKLNIYSSRGSKIVKFTDKNGVRATIYINKFKELYELM